MTQQQLDPTSQLKHVFQFLTDLYQSTHDLKTVLDTQGISQGAAYTAYLPLYLARLYERWQVVIKGALGERQAEIIIQRYGLNGQVRPTLSELANKYGVSRERLRRMEFHQMRLLRAEKQGAVLLQIALDVAHEV